MVPKAPHAQPLKYIWDTSRIFPFESLYGILSKFTQQNLANTNDVWKEFGRRKDPNHTESHHIPNLNLNYEDRLNSDALHFELGIPSNAIKYAHIYPYLLPLYYESDEKTVSSIPMYRSAIHDELRYCPDCMLNYYHTPLFQAKWIHVCPVHKTALETLCPECGHSIPYSLESKTFKHYFSCSCGASLSSRNKKRVKKQTTNKKIILQIALYLRWLKGIESQPALKHRHIGMACSERLYMELHDGYHYVTEYWVKVYPPHKSILPILTGKDSLGLTNRAPYPGPVGRSIEICTTPNAKLINLSNYLSYKRDALPRKHDWIQCFESEKKAFKSEYLRPHLFCLNKVNTVINENGLVNYSFICPYAFAYILWKLYWRDEHSKILDSAKPHPLIIRHPHYLRLKFYRQYFHDHLLFSLFKTGNVFKILDWLMLNIFRLFLLCSFDEALKYALNTAGWQPGHPIAPNFINANNNLYFILRQDCWESDVEFIAWEYKLRQTLKKKMHPNDELSHHLRTGDMFKVLQNTPIPTSNTGVNPLTQWCHNATHQTHYKSVINDVFKDTTLDI